MPTDKPRTMITFRDEELRQRVETYRFEHRFKSQNDALMSLIDKGIEQLAGETHAEPTIVLSDEDKRVLKAYHSADESAKYYAIQMLENNPADKKENRA